MVNMNCSVSRPFCEMKCFPKLLEVFIDVFTGMIFFLRCYVVVFVCWPLSLCFLESCAWLQWAASSGTSARSLVWAQETILVNTHTHTQWSNYSIKITNTGTCIRSGSSSVHIKERLAYKYNTHLYFPFFTNLTYITLLDIIQQRRSLKHYFSASF